MGVTMTAKTKQAAHFALAANNDLKRLDEHPHVGSAVEGARFPGSTGSHVGRPVLDMSQCSASKPSITVMGV